MSISPSRHSTNLAARMAAWSGKHRKKAFWGWLAFVLVVFALGSASGTTNISEVEQFSGDSANKAIEAVIGDDLGKAGALSLPVTLIILILTFGSLVAAGLP